jgi:hypothetical protein
MEISSYMITMFLGMNLFGLPYWWCLASAVFVAILLIFLIYIFFKGRSMMHRKERSTGIRSITCSVCRIHLNKDSLSCPGCSSTFSKDRFLCPRCGKEIGKRDKKCSGCDAPLRRVRFPEQNTMMEYRDPDLRKLKMPYMKKELEECTSCGALKDPGKRCPVCKESS